MLVLMNSTMCPEEGTYHVKRVTKDEARMIFAAHKAKGWISFVGYESTAQYMSKVLGAEIPVSRNVAKLEHGDLILVCKLSYRVDPDEKRKNKPSDEDFEWWLMRFER